MYFFILKNYTAKAVLYQYFLKIDNDYLENVPKAGQKVEFPLRSVKIVPDSLLLAGIRISGPA
jgi:hypothetical protein